MYCLEIKCKYGNKVVKTNTHCTLLAIQIRIIKFRVHGTLCFTLVPNCNLPRYSDKFHFNFIRVSVEITNKMQPCNRIYYSTVH